jgi:RNA polymerase sigma factor (sigma-70 family)
MQSVTFALAYEANFLKTVRLLRSRGIRGEAEEIAQAAWVQAWERLSQLRHAEALPMWVNSIALNIFRTNHRSQERFQNTHREPSCLPINGIAALDAAKLLHTCSDNDRHMLEQHYVHGYNVREIADEYGCSNGALRLRLMRAKRKIAAARPRSRLTASI